MKPLAKNKLAWGVVGIIALLVFYGAVSLEDTAQVQITNFQGISTDRAPTDDLAIARELVNADIIVRGDQRILKQRAGYTKLGGGLEDHPVSGIFRYDPIGALNQIVVTSGSGVYSYSAPIDLFRRANSNPFTSICTVTSGLDTVKGSNTFWWELSYRDIDSIKIWDADGDTATQLLIKSILSDNRIVLSDNWPAPTGNAAACTLSGSYTEGTDSLFDISGGARRGLTFMDTLLITSADKRVKYISKSEGCDKSELFDGMGTFYPLGPNSFTSVSFTGGGIDFDYTSSGREWVQIECPNVSGGERQRNQLFYVIGDGDNYVRVKCDTLIYEALKSNPDSVWYVKQVPVADVIDGGETDSINFECVLRCTVGVVDIDSSRGTTNIKMRTTIYVTGQANVPQDWPVDMFDYGGVYRGEADADNLSRHFKDATLKATGDSTCIVIDLKINAGDSLILWEPTWVSVTIDIDTNMHEDWYYPIQAQLTNRLYYTGANDDPSLLWWFEEFVLDSNANYGSVYINRNDGDEITALVPYNRDLIIFKRWSIYRGVLSPYDNEIDEIVRAESPTGAPSQEAVVEYGGLIYFVSPPLGVFAFNGVRAVNISGPTQFYFADSIAEGTETSIRTVVYNDPTIGTPSLYISYVSLDGTENDRTLRYDLVTRQWSKYCNFAGSAFGLQRGTSGYGDTLLIGTAMDGDSYILKFPSSRKDTGEFIDMSYLSGFSSFGSLLARKHWDKYVPVFHSATNGSLITSWHLDWSGTAAHVDTIAASSGWQGPRRELTDMVGKSVAFKIETASAESLEVAGVEIYYREKGQQ